jgi:hypothetical protein
VTRCLTRVVRYETLGRDRGRKTMATETVIKQWDVFITRQRLVTENTTFQIEADTEEEAKHIGLELVHDSLAGETEDGSTGWEEDMDEAKPVGVFEADAFENDGD